jgi:hypothetical protein
MRRIFLALLTASTLTQTQSLAACIDPNNILGLYDAMLGTVAFEDAYHLGDSVTYSSNFSVTFSSTVTSVHPDFVEITRYSSQLPADPTVDRITRASFETARGNFLRIMCEGEYITTKRWGNVDVILVSAIATTVNLPHFPGTSGITVRAIFRAKFSDENFQNDVREVTFGVGLPAVGQAVGVAYDEPSGAHSTITADDVIRIL